MVNTFEWCDPSCAPEIDNLQQFPCEALNFHMELLHDSNGLFNVYDINSLEEEAYQILEPQGIKSMLHAELLDENGQCCGVLGVDECRERKYWSGLQTKTLKACGEQIGKALSRYPGKAMNLQELQAFVALRKS